MKTTVITTRVGDDGVLKLEVPLGLAEAGQECTVTLDTKLKHTEEIESTMETTHLLGKNEEWKRSVVRAYEFFKDEDSFVRPPQSDYEVRDPME